MKGQLAIALIYISFCSEYLLYRNLRKVTELVNIVADSRYRLYDDFVDDKSERLSKYLAAVQQAIMKGLEGGGAHPFRIIDL